MNFLGHIEIKYKIKTQVSSLLYYIIAQNILKMYVFILFEVFTAKIAAKN